MKVSCRVMVELDVVVNKDDARSYPGANKVTVGDVNSRAQYMVAQAVRQALSGNAFEIKTRRKSGEDGMESTLSIVVTKIEIDPEKDV